MRKVMLLFFISTLLTLALLSPSIPKNLSVSAQATKLVVTGKVELLNSKAKLPSGKIDTGGIVIALEPINAPSPLVKKIVEMTQKDKKFVPHVVAVQVGGAVDFPNKDPFFHNVYSVFAGRIFDLGLYQSGASRNVPFKRKGVSYIFCNIHPQMSGVVVSFDTPYFATTNIEGEFQITDIPRGQYRLKVWHERATENVLNNLTRQINVDKPIEVKDIKIDETGHTLLARPDKYNVTGKTSQHYECPNCS